MKIPQIAYREDNFFGFLFLLVLVVPFVFTFFLYESFEIIKFGLFGFFLFLAILVKLWQKPVLVEDQKWYGNKYFFFSLLVFVVWAILSSVFAWDKNLALFGFYPRFTNSLLFLFLWVLLTMVFGLLSLPKRNTLLKFLVFTGVVVGFWGLSQSAGFGYYQGVKSEFFIRAPSFLGNPNFSSMYVSALLPLLVVYFTFSKKFWQKILLGVSIFVSIWSVTALTSRGALFSMFVALFAGFGLSFYKKNKTLAINFAICIVLAGSLFGIFWNLSRPGSVANTLTLKEYNIEQRFSIWQLSAEAIYKRPMFGAGLSNFPLIFERERGSNAVLNVGIYDDPHNLILLLASTGGIPLALLFLGIIFTSVFRGFNNLKKVENYEVLGVLAGISAWFIGAMFNPVAIPCYLILALFLSFMFLDSGKPLPKVFQNFNFKLIGSIIALFFVLAFTVFLISEHFFGAGMRLYKVGDFKEASIKLEVAEKLGPHIFLHRLYSAGSSVLAGQNLEITKEKIERIKALNPNWSITTSGLANVYYLLYIKTGDSKLIPVIREYLHRSIELNPFSQYNYFMSAQFEYVFGNLNQALIYSKQSVTLTRDNPKFWLLLAKLYQETGKREQMIYALGQAQKYAPETQPQFKWLWQAAQKEPDVKKFNFRVQLGLGGLD